MPGFQERVPAAIERLPELLGRLLLPSTDTGVVLQLVLAVALTGWLLWVARHRPEWRLVVIGSALVLLGLFGLRAAH